MPSGCPDKYHGPCQHWTDTTPHLSCQFLTLPASVPLGSDSDTWPGYEPTGTETHPHWALEETHTVKHLPKSWKTKECQVFSIIQVLFKVLFLTIYNVYVHIYITLTYNNHFVFKDTTFIFQAFLSPSIHHSKSMELPKDKGEIVKGTVERPVSGALGTYVYLDFKM